MEGRFFNPHDRTERAWNYGILFHPMDERDGYRLSVPSDAEWYLELATRESGQTKVPTIAWEHTPNMDLAANGSKVLRLVCREKTVYFFFVNSAFVTSLDVSKWTGTGDLALVAGLFRQHTSQTREPGSRDSISSRWSEAAKIYTDRLEASPQLR